MGLGERGIGCSCILLITVLSGPRWDLECSAMFEYEMEKNKIESAHIHVGDGDFTKMAGATVLKLICRKDFLSTYLSA